MCTSFSIGIWIPISNCHALFPSPFHLFFLLLFSPFPFPLSPHLISAFRLLSFDKRRFDSRRLPSSFDLLLFGPFVRSLNQNSGSDRPSLAFIVVSPHFRFQSGFARSAPTVRYATTIFVAPSLPPSLLPPPLLLLLLPSSIWLEPARCHCNVFSIELFVTNAFSNAATLRPNSSPPPLRLRHPVWFVCDSIKFTFRTPLAILCRHSFGLLLLFSSSYTQSNHRSSLFLHAFFDCFRFCNTISTYLPILLLFHLLLHLLNSFVLCSAFAVRPAQSSGFFNPRSLKKERRCTLRHTHTHTLNPFGTQSIALCIH